MSLPFFRRKNLSSHQSQIRLAKKRPAFRLDPILQMEDRVVPATLYWDANGATAGFGTASGTWGSSAFWSTNGAGTSAAANPPITTADGVNFGNAGTGLGAGTIAGPSTAQGFQTMTFASGSGAVTLNGGTLNLNGAGSTITVDNASATIGTVLQGSGASLIKAGTGALTLSGANTYDGGTTINGGSLTVAGSLGTGAIYGGVISGSGSFTKAGSGTQTLNGATVNSFNGGLSINGGTLALDFANLDTPTDLINSGNTLGIGGNSALTIKGRTGAVATSQTLGNFTLNAGANQILLNPNGGTSTTLNLGSLTTSAASSSLLLGTAAGAGSGTVEITTTTNKDAQGIYGGRLVFTSDGGTTADWATTNTVASPYTISAYSGYSALATTAGTDTNNSRATANTTLTGSVTTNSLKIEAPAAGQSLALGANLLTLASGGLLATGTNAFTISGTAGGTRLTAGNGSGAYDLIVHQYNSGGLTIGAVIGDNAANSVSLVKAGPGNLTLSGTNTYNGATYVNGGTLTISSNANLGNQNTGTGSVTVVSSANNSPTVTISGTSAPAGFVGSTFLGSVVTSITPGSPNTTVTLANNANATLTNSVQSFSFLGNSLYLNGATLRTTASVGLFNGTAGTNNRPVVISNGATFNTDAGTTLQVPGAISGSGGLTKTGTGNLEIGTVTGGTFTASTFTGGVIVNGGTLSLLFANHGSNIIPISNSITLAGATLSVGSASNRNNDQTLNGLAVISGDNFMSLNKGTGPNGLTLAAGSITRSGASTLNITTNGIAPSTHQTTTANTNGILGPWAFFGTGSSTRYATGAGNITGLTGTPAADGAGLGNTPTANYDLAAGGGTVQASVSANTIRYSGAAGTTAPGATLFQVNGLLNAGTGTWTIGSGALTIGSTNELVVNTANAGITLSAPITGGSSTAIIKNGPGRLTLSGDSSGTYSGTTYFYNGTLSLGSPGALGTGSLLIGTPNSTAALSLDSSVATQISTTNAQTWNSNFTFVGTNSLDLGNGTVTLAASRTVAVNANTLTVGCVPALRGSLWGPAEPSRSEQARSRSTPSATA